MNGGLAARQPVAPEPAAPARPAPVPAAPVMEPATADVASTRDRMQASFGAEDTEPLTTRDRIVNRALATEEVEAPAPAPVVDIGEARERLRPEAAVPAPGGEPAEVIELATRTEPTARAPPGPPAPAEAPAPGATVAEDAQARPPPEPEVVDTAPDPEAEVAAPVDEALLVPEVPQPAGGPEDDPAFEAMKERTDESATLAKDHQPARTGAAVAQAASEPDVERDKLSKGAEERVGAMEGAKPGEFDVEKFKTDVAKAVDRMAPPATLKEADEFRESRKAGGAAAAIKGVVTTGKTASEAEIKKANAVPPDPAGKTPKEVVTPMVNDRVGPPLPGVDAESALPGLRPDSEVDLSQGPLAIKMKLAEAKVTEPQLAEGNEPAFDAALDATAKVREHAAAGPAGFREQEAGVLDAAKGEAGPAAAAQLEGMRDSRGNALGGVLGKKNSTKDADKKLHEDVHAKILDIHARTQEDVQKILGLLDTAVESIFTTGEEAARKTFEEDVARDMRAYKADRYGGWFGWTKWLKDRWFDLPSTVNKFYKAGREKYLEAMGRVIETIAQVVGFMLGLAHLRIVAGRAEVTDYVETKLPAGLKMLGRTTAADLDHKFDDLAGDVDAKRDELVDTVARLYIDSRSKLDDRIKELKEANKGLISRAIDAVIGVLKTIYELGKLLLRVLLKAASAIGDILGSPIRFLRNLVGAVKGGLDRFATRIWEHLQKALLDLLLGELGGVGITLPKQLDFAGILDLVLQVLGVTYADIRARLVDRFGPEAVAHMEATVDIFKKVRDEGLGGLWELIKDKLGDLEDLVVGKIKAYIVERVIRAGIGYIAALLNPAAAFIKACQGIYQIVMFVVERARQIAAFVESVLDSISAIARGDTGEAVERIDNALGNALSLAVAFLGRLAGLGSLSEKVRSIIAAIRRPVTRAIDLVVFGAAGLYRRTIGRAVAFGREKVASGKELLKGKTAAERRRAKAPPEPPPVKVPTSAPEDPAVAATTSRLPPPPPPVAVHEPFRSEGHSHELYTAPDNKKLLVASNGPTPLTNVPDPSGQIVTLDAQYQTALTRYNSAVAQVERNPRSRPGVDAAKIAVNQAIDAIVAHLRTLGFDDAPRASAPGLGAIRRHGRQTSSITEGPLIWWLESEHIMPFAVGKMLWDTLGKLIPERGGTEDDQQTTIMIYERAADWKTRRHDDTAWRTFQSTYISQLEPAVDALRRIRHEEAPSGFASRGVRLTAATTTAEHQFAQVFHHVLAGMEVISDSAVDATERAARIDHTTTDPGRNETRGARRAETAPLPPRDQIVAAAKKQYRDVINLARRALEGTGR